METLRRGFAVIRAVSVLEPCTLHDLYLDLGFSKPALLRILSVLEEEGVIFRPIGRKQYYLSASQRRSVDALFLHRLLQEISGPVLKELARETKWPSELTLRSGNQMVIINSNISRSAFAIDPPEDRLELDMLYSAVGITFLANIPFAAREKIISSIHDENGVQLTPLNREKFEAELEQTRQRGYGIRRHFGADKFGGIAVPIFTEGNLIACLSLGFLNSATTVTEIASQHLQKLNQAAAQISDIVTERIPPQSLQVE